MKNFIAILLLMASVSLSAAEMTIVWDRPLKRENGATLSADEIGGYEIYQTDAQNTEGGRNLIGTADGLAEAMTMTTSMTVGTSIYIVMVAYDLDFVYSEWSNIASYTKSRPGKAIIRSVKVVFNR